ncbi:MAG: HyaD/HybD family hydrogenase maturation endopeptidase [Solirubrobacteraceae bacterium]
MSPARGGVVVIGIGNVVCADDGLGVHAVRRLRERHRHTDHVELIEGGTAGLLLLPHVADARRAIIVDAIDTGAAPGTLIRLDALDWAEAFAGGLSPHDVGLRDLLGAARFSGAWPQELVLHGIQPCSTAIGTKMSAPVAAALDALVDRIAAELAAWSDERSPARAGSA